MRQSSNTVVMVRPHHFASNPETMGDNAFQSVSENTQSVAEMAYNEMTQVVEQLRGEGVTVHLFEDESTQTPDSVFPNNWFTTHETGELILYPMYCNNRRKERREDIIGFLRNTYGYTQTLDFSSYEHQELYLEGTGSIVFDHEHKLAYAARSKRMSESLLNKLCEHIGYTPVAFDATGSDGTLVYHTNVLMAVGSGYVLCAVDMIRDPDEREAFKCAVAGSGKTLITLSEQQISAFAGNTLELVSEKGNLLAISTTAYDALTPQQREQLEQWVTLLPLNVPTIELGGGSIRCMLAQVFQPTMASKA